MINKLILQLKEKLDKIDARVYDEAYDGLYQAGYKTKMGMWEKGEVIAGEFTPLNSPTYRELERQTGRDHKSLKSWHELYNKYPDKKEYKKIAEEEAQKWAEERLTPRKIQQIEALPMVEGTFRVVYADPPWKYNDELIEGYGAANHHYPQMTIEELCEMKLPSIDENAVLFLWTTSPLLEDAFKVVNAWNFQYKASFIWDKVRHNFGHYNSMRHEILLICTRGSCVPDIKELIDSVQVIERTNVHSEKPERFREIIDELYPHGNRIELFARSKHKGWKVWGNQV